MPLMRPMLRAKVAHSVPSAALTLRLQLGAEVSIDRLADVANQHTDIAVALRDAMNVFSRAGSNPARSNLASALMGTLG